MHSPNHQNIEEFIKHQELILPITRQYLDVNNLDIGCGNGITSVIHHDRIGINPTLCDVVDIRSGLAKNFPFFLLTNNILSFENKSFGSSYIQYVLHHMPQEEVFALLKEADRVSNRIIIIEEIKTEKTNLMDALRFDNVVNEAIHPGTPMPVYQYFTLEELTNILNSLNRNKIFTYLISEGGEENGWIDTYALIA